VDRSRLHAAAAACLVASGLFVGSACSAVAFGDTGPEPGNSRDQHSDGGGDPGAPNRGQTSDGADNSGNKGPKRIQGSSGVGESTDKPRADKPGEGGPRPGRDGDSSGQPPSKADGSSNPKPPNPPKDPGGESPPPPWEEPPPLPCEVECPGEPPGQPPPPTSGGGGGGGGQQPEFHPTPPPDMQLPHELQLGQPAEPGVVSALPGAAGAVLGAGTVAAPLAVPLVPLPAVPGIGFGGAGGSAALGVPGAPNAVIGRLPAARAPLPTSTGSTIGMPGSSFRVGYAHYLRTAGMSQLAALALPGVAGMLVLTGAGGLLGYRQAKAGHAVRTGGTARFLEE
jgi:hypothetical protein